MQPGNNLPRVFKNYKKKQGEYNSMVLCFNSPYYVRRTTQQTTKKKVRIRLHNGYGSTRISSNLTVHFLTNGKKKKKKEKSLA